LNASQKNTGSDFLPTACLSTVERLQLVLDGELEFVVIEADPHLGLCAACRQRIGAARLLFSIPATIDFAPPPIDLTDRILVAVQEDRYSRVRRRTFVVTTATLAALAASILLVLNFFMPKPDPRIEWTRNAPVVPAAPTPKPETAPEPRPIPTPEVGPLRIGEELTKAGLALRESPRVITEPAAAAPQVFTKLTNVLTFPDGPIPDAVPAHAALVDLPEAALTGLEPLTGTAQKAFSRLMRDVGGVSLKPKS
jgi:hypothetical protein